MGCSVSSICQFLSHPKCMICEFLIIYHAFLLHTWFAKGIDLSLSTSYELRTQTINPEYQLKSQAC